MPGCLNKAYLTRPACLRRHSAANSSVLRGAHASLCLWSKSPCFVSVVRCALQRSSQHSTHTHVERQLQLGRVIAPNWSSRESAASHRCWSRCSCGCGDSWIDEDGRLGDPMARARVRGGHRGRRVWGRGELNAVRGGRRTAPGVASQEAHVPAARIRRSQRNGAGLG